VSSDEQGTAGAVEAPARLAALAETRLMDSPAEASFDRATRLAQRLLGAPVSLVSLVDDRRQFFKSAVGLPEPWASRRQTPLSHSFCRTVVAAAAPLVVEDATIDERVRGNGAIEGLGVVAYLGVPVHGPDGDLLGTLCAIEHVPRRWAAEDLAALTDLAAGVTAEIALRVQGTRLEAFTRSAAHELRTPVTSLGLRLEELAGWSIVGDEVRAELVAALAQVRRLADQLDGHLELARTGRVGVDEEVVLDRLLLEVAGRWRTAASERGIELRVATGSEVRAVVPAAAVEQVLDLLLEEAVYAACGPVVVRTSSAGGVSRIEVVTEPPRVDAATEVRRGAVDEAALRRRRAAEIARSFGGRLVSPVGGSSVQLLLPRRA
jgi:signal transduction histidine kinase